MTIPTTLSNRDIDAVHARLQHVSTMIRDAGAIALDYFNNAGELKIRNKGQQDWVSEADTRVEHFISDSLHAQFPEDAVIGEEHGLKEADKDAYLWIIDPIDGTTCFLKGIPQWCLVIALAHRNETLMTVIYDPVADELYSAVLGGGAWCNGQPIRVATEQTVADGLISIGSSVKLGARQSARFIEWLVDAGGMYSRIGSCALGLAYVASGRLLGMYEPLVYPWDSWGGQLLVSEAGGRVLMTHQGADFDKPGPTMATAPGLWLSMEKQLLQTSGEGT
ncbi:inositol monophosphatase [Saccharospirillum sp.]|uniref:inositol monophosphatase n=1 Tax=Saccharospirillum sp. TaxID=2033801 RepID=UPI0034A03174